MGVISVLFNECFILTAFDTISLRLCASHVVTFTPDSNNRSLTILYRVYVYRVDHKKRPKFSAFEKTYKVSLGKIALVIG